MVIFSKKINFSFLLSGQMADDNMRNPQLLMLDEPSLGIAPLLVSRIFEAIKEINQRGTAILLVEQNALLALNVAQKGYVMETGEIVLSGEAQKLLTTEKVKQAYLGM